eukprot:1570137-Amphidinium_carterae.1
MKPKHPDSFHTQSNQGTSDLMNLNDTWWLVASGKRTKVIPATLGVVWLVSRPHPDRLPFDPRTHPVAFCEYVWILTMYVHFGTFVVDCRAAAKTWVPPDGTIFLQHGDPVKAMPYGKPIIRVLACTPKKVKHRVMSRSVPCAWK